MNKWLKMWLNGLIAAFVGGAANAITLIVIDPVRFNIYTGGKDLLGASVVSGLVSAAFFLKKSPVPDHSVREFTKYGVLALLLGLAPLCFTGCLDKGAPTNAQPAPVEVQHIDKYIPAIKIGTTLACGGYLQFGVKHDHQADQINKMWALSKACYSMVNGRIPTVDELHACIIAYGGSEKDAEYAKLSASIAGAYADCYPIVVKGGYEDYVKVISAIAQSIQNSAAVYGGGEPVSP